MASLLRIDPVCGMPGTIERHGHWFCSPGCAARYERARGVTGAPPAWDWRRDRVVWAAALLAAVFAASWAVPAVRPVAAALGDYLRRVGLAIAAGLVVGGIVDQYVPNTYISKVLTGRRRRTLLAAAGLGVLASACSHGVIALSMELHRKGASAPAVITFLLASPWASLPVTFLLIRLMGWAGVVVIAAAVLVAILTGLVFQRLAHRRLIEPNPHTVVVAEDFSIRRDLLARLRGRRWTPAALREDAAGVARGAWGLAQMVVWWVTVGLVLSSAVAGWVPASALQQYFGPTVLGLLATLGLATVMEVCSEGTAPLGYELYRQTGALGNTFAFLMGGVITDYTELSLVWANLGRRTALWLLAVTLPQVFVIGYLLNAIQ